MLRLSARCCQWVCSGSPLRLVIRTGCWFRNAAKSRKKTKYLKNLLRTYDAVAVQELHGDKIACKRFANDYRHSHLLNFSSGPSLATGGIAFFTKCSITDRSTAPPALDVFEAGRAGTLTLAFEDGDIFINNVHYVDLKDEHAVVRRVTAYNRRARSNSSGRSVSFVAGDFNFSPQGEKASRVGIDGVSFPTVADSGHHARRGRVWAPALRDTVEFHQPEPSRIGTANNSDGDHYIIASRLDRIYSSFLPLQHTLINIKTTTIGNVSSSIGVSANGSDHVAIGVIISIKRRCKRPNNRCLDGSQSTRY